MLPIGVGVGCLDCSFLWREQKILSVLQQGYSGTLENLTPIAYDDVDENLRMIAQFSLWAHLIKLEKEGVVRKEGEVWVLR